MLAAVWKSWVQNFLTPWSINSLQDIREILCLLAPRKLSWPGLCDAARKTRSFPQFPRQSAEWWEARCDECWELKFPPGPHFIFVDIGFSDPERANKSTKATIARTGAGHNNINLNWPDQENWKYLEIYKKKWMFSPQVMTASKVQWQWSFLITEWLCIQQQPVIRTSSSITVILSLRIQQDVSIRERGVAQPAESLRNYLLQVCAALFISGVISTIPPEPHLSPGWPRLTPPLSSASNYPFYWLWGILFARTIG